ncbi:MAG TPA: cytidylate kinase [Euryarchaeota archaeon]|nr:MAG: cytidylate kinase [Thermoplasmatales archaeon ex4484_6]RLF68374.1 MAG: cytidylate kinase [Thermoplasmata archaeon]HHD16720.1 cytidylate kinase [Euryarchaeota archaeon]
MTVITVGGPPGSGTSTVCGILKERTGFKYVYAGKIFRKMAKDEGKSLEEFQRICEKDPSIDIELDRKMLDKAKSGEDLILEGRMIGPLCKKESIPSFKVYIFADTGIRARRLVERDGGSMEAVIEKMKERERSEAKRYMTYYGMDPGDLSLYDLAIDSSHLSPEEEVSLILEHLDGFS